MVIALFSSHLCYSAKAHLKVAQYKVIDFNCIRILKPPCFCRNYGKNASILNTASNAARYTGIGNLICFLIVINFVFKSFKLITAINMDGGEDEDSVIERQNR